MRKKTKIGLIAALLAVLAGTALFCACGSEPSYYGSYYAGTGSNSSVYTINGDGFYLGSPSNLYQTKYDYTYANGSIFLNSGIEFGLYENDQVLCINLLKDVGLADRFTVRDGHFDAMIRFMESYSVTIFIEFTIDGSYAMTTVNPYSRETGTYSLNNGVLIYNKQMEVDSYGQASTMNEQHYAYIDSNYSFYAATYVKNADQFSGNSTGGGNTNTPETPEPTPSTYTLTYTATEGGRIVGSPTQTVSAGANGDSVMAIADEGYEFIGWSDGVQTAERLDENVWADISVTAQFEKIPEYTLNYSAQRGGYIRGDALQTVLRGESGTTVTAVAEKGYEFVGWSDGVQSAERLDENVTENISVSAQFEKIPEYTLSYSAQTGGTIQGNALQTVLRGEDGTAVTAVAEEGYEFVGWSDGVQSAERLDENVTANITVTAQFAKIPEYTLNYSAQTGGTIHGNTSQTVLHGEDGTAVTAVAENGYEFVGWSDGVQTAERLDESVTENITVTAQFERNNTVQFAGGSGTALNPYRITTAQHLENMELYPAAHYILTGNIVLTSVGQGQSNFTPLFDDETMFTGTFDGNGYTISNLTIYNTSTFYTGLFACIGADGKVFDLTLESVHLQGTNYIGGVAGYALGAVTNCTVTGEIAYLSQNNYGVFLGGVAGRAENDLNGCTAEVAITANEVGGTTYAGGIAGYCAYNMQSVESVITLVSRSAVTVTKTESNNNAVYAGGIFGYVAERLKLQDCFVEGNIVISNNSGYAGGLVGYFGNTSTLWNCYATGDVSGYYAGGLVGYFGSSNTLTNCYATGEVSGNNYAGGLVGFLGGQFNTLTNCYATGEVSGNYYVGGLVGYFENSSNTLTNCYAIGDITVNAQNSNTVYVGGLVGRFFNSNTLTNCYATGNITVNAQSNNAIYAGGLVGRFGSDQNIIQNSYSTSKIICTGTADTAYLGGLVGYAQEVTLSNAHWLYFVDSGTEYAVGYSSTLGIPTNIGATKHSGIAEFYTLADTLNEGQETPAWEHTGANTLPTLIRKENETAQTSQS